MNKKQMVALRGIREYAGIIKGQTKSKNCDETRYSACLAEEIEKRVDYIMEEEKEADREQS